jgi:hypothetical protein
MKTKNKRTNKQNKESKQKFPLTPRNEIKQKFKKKKISSKVVLL